MARIMLRILAAIAVFAALASPASGLTHSEILERVRPAVVTVVAYDAAGYTLAQGTGFIAKPDGRIITRARTISGAAKVKVFRHNGAAWTAQGLVAWDGLLDFAVLQVAGESLPTIALADSDRVQEKDKVVAIGSEIGSEQTACFGMVNWACATKGSVKLLLVSTPFISGSPVLNLEGEAVAVATDSKIKFATPINPIKAKLAVRGTVMPFPDAGRCVAEYIVESEAASLRGKGMGAASEGHYEEAVGDYREAIRLKPDYPEAHYSLGLAYYNLGHYQDAVSSFKEAIKLKPDYPEAHYSLGAAYYELGRYQDTVDNCKEAIRIEPSCASPHKILGLAYVIMGRKQDGVDSFKEAIRLKPDYAEAHRGLGATYLILGDRGSALDEYKILKGLDADKAAELFKLLYP